MAMLFNPTHRIEFLNIGNVLRDSFQAEFEDYFMAEFKVVNNSLERCKKIK